MTDARRYKICVCVCVCVRETVSTFEGFFIIFYRVGTAHICLVLRSQVAEN